MNNVLYAIPENERVSFIKKVYDSLKSGGILIINDPGPQAYDREKFGNLLYQLINDATKKEAPITQAEIGLIVGINTEVLVGAKKTNQFLSHEQLTTLVENTGFRLQDSSQGYAGIVNRYVFTKP